jgi:heme/copper-type cytochrome/quinol oxidase subunit 2
VIPVWRARNIQNSGEECRVAPERGSKKRNLHFCVVLCCVVLCCVVLCCVVLCCVVLCCVLASFAQRTIIVVLVSVVAIVAVIIVAIQAVYLTEDVRQVSIVATRIFSPILNVDGCVSEETVPSIATASGRRAATQTRV